MYRTPEVERPSDPPEMNRKLFARVAQFANSVGPITRSARQASAAHGGGGADIVGLHFPASREMSREFSVFRSPDEVFPDLVRHLKTLADIPRSDRAGNSRQRAGNFPRRKRTVWCRKNVDPAN
jgi:hypothetical protein